MPDESRSRRRLLEAVTVVGLGAGAGCVSNGFSDSPEYVCTDIDDEAVERVPPDESPIPLGFARPSVMEQVRSDRSDGGGRIEYEQEWKSKLLLGRDTIYRITLLVRYKPTRDGRSAAPREYRRAGLGVIGKRSHAGKIVGVFEYQHDPQKIELFLQYPVDDDDGHVYDIFTVRMEAIGITQEVSGNDADQTCEAALRAVATGVIDSVEELSRVESKTSLGLSPSETSVKRGSRVDLSVEADGVDWVDLLIESEESEYSYLGSLEVGADPAPITVAPPTGSGSSDVVTTSAEATLNTHESIGEVSPATYTIKIAAAGRAKLVTDTSTLSVKPAN